MTHTLKYTKAAEGHLLALKNSPSHQRIFKDVVKALRLMESNLRHPSLNTHEYHNLLGPNGEKVFEAYAQQGTPGAYRIFWYYGPKKNDISIIDILKHSN
ncbi:MAG: hypothetical protein WCE21_04780 [Candidatus Babeliales bacterium]